MKKLAIAALAALVALAGLVTTGQLAFFSVFVSSAQAAEECRPAHAVLGAPSGPVRIPMTASFQITSEYGMRHNPGQISHGQYRLHAGIDFAYVGASTDVVAIMAGVVTSTPTTASGGNMVWIDHGGGLQSRSLHLRSRSVQVGDTVAAGTPIGVEGSTGNSTGAHLHLEILQSGEPLNPRTWFAGQGVVLPALRVTTAGQPATTDTGATVLTVGQTLPGAPPTNAAAGTLVDQLPQSVGAYSGEQLTNAREIIRAGQDLGLDAHTITIGVMTAIGESTLRNLHHGDRAGPDSRGLFQQRDNGAWGSLADRTSPYTAATNFFRALIRVPGYRELEPTIAANRTQRNADPYHYRPHWGSATAIVSALTGDPTLAAGLAAGGAMAGCTTTALGELPPAGTGTGQGIVDAAMAYLGTPYSWGGGSIDGPTTGTYTSASLNGTNTVGFDCSGLTMYAVHRATGITLRHSAEAQAHDTRGTLVRRDQLQPGDIIAFSQDGSGRPGTYGHVGIYAGDGRMVHANRPGVPLEVIDLDASAYFQAMHWTVRRYTPTV